MTATMEAMRDESCAKTASPAGLKSSVAKMANALTRQSSAITSTTVVTKVTNQASALASAI